VTEPGSSAGSPRLSIIVATFNAASTLERCIASIKAQAFGSWELLVADGASTDSTVDIIRRSAPDIAYWHSHRDTGIYDAWNQALAHARGEYVAFLGADDQWHSQQVLADVFAAIGDRHFDLVTGRGCLMDVEGHRYHAFGSAWDYRKIMRRMTICHPGALHRRELFQQFGLFDPTFRISADYDFLLRLPADLRTLYVPSVLVDVADGGISRDRRWQMLGERFRAQAHCARVGRVRATLNTLDKLWRIPVAKVLGIPN
jgi:glycosyltransferase involved in cell wall biosynthesis